MPSSESLTPTHSSLRMCSSTGYVLYYYIHVHVCVCVYSVALLGHPVDVVSLLGNGLCVALSTIWIYITQLGLTAHKHTHTFAARRGGSGYTQRCICSPHSGRGTILQGEPALTIYVNLDMYGLNLKPHC